MNAQETNEKAQLIVGQLGFHKIESQSWITLASFPFSNRNSLKCDIDNFTG